MTSMKKLLYSCVIVAAFLLGALLQFLLFENEYFAISADESGRTLEAFQWAHHKSLEASVWLPLHTIVTGLALDLHQDLFLTPRIISNIVGLVSLALLIVLAHEIFHSRKVTAIVALAGAVFPPRIILSVVPLSEILFIALVIAGSIFIVRWLREYEPREVLLASMLMTLASAVRYEGWVFAGVFCLIIFAEGLKRRYDVKSLLMAGGIAASFPVLWLILHTSQHGDPLAFISVPAENYHLTRGNDITDRLINSFPFQFLQQNIQSLNILGLFALTGFIPRGEYRLRVFTALVVVAFVILSMLSIGGIALPNHSFWRIPVVFSMLLIPWTAWWIVQQENPVRVSGARYLVMGLTLLLVIQSIVQLKTMTRYSDFGRDERTAGLFIGKLLEGEDPDHSLVLIESSRWAYLHVMVASQQPEMFLCNSGKDPSLPELPLVTVSNKELDVERLLSMKIHYLIFERKPIVDYLDAQSSFRKLATFGRWTVFEIVGRKEHPKATTAAGMNRQSIFFPATR